MFALQKSLIYALAQYQYIKICHPHPSPLLRIPIRG